MNENDNTTAAADPVELLADPDTGETLDPAPEETTEIMQVVVEDRPLMTTDFASYTVTEGLLLLIFLLMVIKLCLKMVKEGFSWLFW